MKQHTVLQGLVYYSILLSFKDLLAVVIMVLLCFAVMLLWRMSVFLSIRARSGLDLLIASSNVILLGRRIGRLIGLLRTHHVLSLLSLSRFNLLLCIVLVMLLLFLLNPPLLLEVRELLLDSRFCIIDLSFDGVFFLGT